MTATAIGFSFLTDLDLGNHNAGEGGSQLSNLKKFDNRPYISGQAYRHGIKDALSEVVEDPSTTECTSRYACGEVEDCKICDIFGYMNTDSLGGEDEPPEKRLSPLRVSPLVGQYDLPQTTDMILQYDESEEADNRIGYRELARNTYRGGVMVDIPAIGRRETSTVESDADHDEIYKRTFTNEIGEDERIQRMKELVDAVRRTTQLAGQARHMADFMPDLVIGATLPEYNQRLQTALQADRETQELETATMRQVVRDLDAVGADLFVAGNRNPNAIDNWDEVMNAADDIESLTVCESVTDCFERVKESASDD
jgi:CRISPR-associated protein Cas7/Cst2/DevR subtype I-B